MVEGQVASHNPSELVRRQVAAQDRQLVTQQKTQEVQGNRHAATTRSYKVAHQKVFLRYHHKVSIQEGNEKVNHCALSSPN